MVNLKNRFPSLKSSAVKYNFARVHPRLHIHDLNPYLCPKWKDIDQIQFDFKELVFIRWNHMDMLIVILSVVGIIIEDVAYDNSIPINPTIVRFMRVLRIARGELLLAYLTLACYI